MDMLLVVVVILFSPTAGAAMQMGSDIYSEVTGDDAGFNQEQRWVCPVK
jgi:hypothetical protein